MLQQSFQKRLRKSVIGAKNSPYQIRFSECRARAATNAAREQNSVELGASSGCLLAGRGKA